MVDRDRSSAAPRRRCRISAVIATVATETTPGSPNSETSRLVASAEASDVDQRVAQQQRADQPLLLLAQLLTRPPACRPCAPADACAPERRRSAPSRRRRRRPSGRAAETGRRCETSMVQPEGEIQCASMAGLRLRDGVVQHRANRRGRHLAGEKAGRCRAPARSRCGRRGLSCRGACARSGARPTSRGGGRAGRQADGAGARRRAPRPRGGQRPSWADSSKAMTMPIATASPCSSASQ